MLHMRPLPLFLSLYVSLSPFHSRARLPCLSFAYITYHPFSLAHPVFFHPVSLSLSFSLRTVMRITRLVSLSLSFSLGPSSVGWRKFSTAGWILRWKMESLEATRGMERERKRERGNGFPRLVVKLLRWSWRNWNWSLCEMLFRGELRES